MSTDEHWWMSISQEEADDPRWGQSGRVHDWRNYIGERTRAIWASFTPEQRLALATDADVTASYEEWE